MVSVISLKFTQCEQKLHIISFTKVGFLVEQLYWITLECTGEPYKPVTWCKITLTQERSWLFSSKCMRWAVCTLLRHFHVVIL